MRIGTKVLLVIIGLVLPYFLLQSQMIIML